MSEARPSHPKPFHRPRLRRAAACGLASVAFALPAGGAAAQTTPPPFPDDDSAIDQYTEEIPTAGGGHVPGTSPEEVTPLPSSVSTELVAEGGDAAGVLEKIATSSAFGAPVSDSRLRAGAGNEGGSPVAAAVSAVGGESGGRLIGLLVALLAIAGSALAVAMWMRRRSGA